MRHAIPTSDLGHNGQTMADAIGSCVHCGFCLPSCPTYVELGAETDSPRGRIFLMKETLEGGLQVETVMPYIDNCLGCLACVSSCPSGVPYGDLLTPFREYAESVRTRPLNERVTRQLVLNTVAYRRRFRVAMRLGSLARPLTRWLPSSLSAMLRLVPDSASPAKELPAVVPAEGRRRGRVALLRGCAQSVLEPEINWATVRVLARNGIETVVPQGQGCCGALAMHTGAGEHARRLARRNLDVFPSDVDAVITTAAGCGSGMREYPLLFRGTPDEEKGRSLGDRTQDVTTFLHTVGLSAPVPDLPRPTTVAYHDACHLAHAQGVREAPRALLAAIGNLKLVQASEPDLCCGSAGTYNIEKPEIASRLGARKARNLSTTGASIITTGNIGCLMQIRSHLPTGDDRPEVLHTMQILDRAYAQPTAGRS